MKTQVNKSRLMKMAWTIYKCVNPYSYSFSAALRRAWEVEKATLEYEAREARKTAIEAENAARSTRISNASVAWAVGAAAYYSNARPGQYFGD